MSDEYILKGVEAIPADDLIEWAEWMQRSASNDHRRVALTRIYGARVSTVFLGLNQQFMNGPPLIFETMIFGGKLDDYQDRCSTYEESILMHALAIIGELDTRPFISRWWWRLKNCLDFP